MTSRGWSGAAVLPPLADEEEGNGVRSIPVSTLQLKDILDSQAARQSIGHVDPLDTPDAYKRPQGLSNLKLAEGDRSSSAAPSMDQLGTPKAKSRRVSLLVGNIAVAPADGKGSDTCSVAGGGGSVDSAMGPPSRSGFQAQKMRKRSKLFLPGDRLMSDETLDELESLAGGHHWWRRAPHVILPTNSYYMKFWYFTMGFAMANAILDPYDLAFGETRGWEAHVGFWSAIEFIGTVVFLIDIVLKFFLAYEDEERKEMVTDFGAIARHYLTGMFWWDVLFWFPFVGVILTARPDFSDGEPVPGVNIPDTAVSTGYYIGLLGFLKLGRLYRIFHLFDHLDHTMVISQMSLMLLRNFVYIMLTCHWYACIFYFIARAEQYNEDSSWIGRNLDRFDGLSAGGVYIYSFYLSVTAFAGLGDGDFYCNSPAESIAMSIYLLFNVVLGAYILGTVTMLMVKGDERSKSYRDRISNLKDYSILNELPQDLHDAMRAHLELHFQSETCSDEHVLALYPSAIKRKVLRHLYLEPLSNCYLFRSCKAKFLDAVLAACRTDLFMPNVLLVSEGDIVSELYMMIEGEVDVLPMHQVSTAETNQQQRTLTSASQHGSDGMSVVSNTKSYSHAPPTHSQSQRLMMREGRAGGAERRSTSECFGEVAFFTETPCTDAVWTVTVVRVLVLPRSAYAALSTAYPNQVRALQTDLRKKTEANVMDIVSEILDQAPAIPGSIHSRLPPCMPTGMLTTAQLPAALLKEIRDLGNPDQQQKLELLDSIRHNVAMFCAKQDRQRVYEMLNAASKGEDDTIKTLLSQGVSASCMDCDHRTPLILASQEGKEATVKLLLDAGANVNALDMFGQSALIAAIKHGQDFVAETLVARGASLAGCTPVILPDVMESVIEGDLAKLARYLRGGADANMCSHDMRTPLHMAASEGSLAAVRILVEAGADVTKRDRWNNLPVDEARNARAMPVVEFLKSVARGPGDASGGKNSPHLRRSTSSCSTGSVTGLGKVLSSNGRRRAVDADDILSNRCDDEKPRLDEISSLISLGPSDTEPSALCRKWRQSEDHKIVRKPSLKRMASSGGRKQVVVLADDLAAGDGGDGGVEQRGGGTQVQAPASPRLGGDELRREDSGDVTGLTEFLEAKSQLSRKSGDRSEEAPLIDMDAFEAFNQSLCKEQPTAWPSVGQRPGEADSVGPGAGPQGQEATKVEQGAQVVPVAPQPPAQVQPQRAPEPRAEPPVSAAAVAEAESIASSSTSLGALPEPLGFGVREAQRPMFKQAQAPQQYQLHAPRAVMTLSTAASSPVLGAQRRQPHPAASLEQQSEEALSALSAAAAAAAELAGGDQSTRWSFDAAVAPSTILGRSDSPVGPSPLGRAPGFAHPREPPSPSTLLQSLVEDAAGRAQGQGRGPHPVRAIRPTTTFTSPHGRVLDVGPRPSTQPALPGMGTHGIGSAGSSTGQPSRSGSPLSFHMAQLMDSMVHRTQDTNARGSGSTASPRDSQPTFWRDSPVFGMPPEGEGQ